MSANLHSELKKEFQLERLILFSDAVFAIAITLLALEIKVPEISKHIVTDHMLLERLDELIPKFLGFFISFMIIGLYWTIHHRMFGFVINYTRRMLWLNLFFLLAVVLMPFSTAMYSEYVIRMLNVPVVIYVSNVCFLGIMTFVLWRYLINPKHNLVEGLDKDEAFYFSLRATIVPIVFAAMGLVYVYVEPRIAVYIPMLTPIIMRLVKANYKRKQKTVTPDQNPLPNP